MTPARPNPRKDPMSTLQISVPLAAKGSSEAASQRPSLMLRILQGVVSAMADTNRRRAQREIARAARTYGLGNADRT